MEERAARVLLEQGEPVKVPAPFLFRLFGKKTITLTIYMPTADCCLRAVRRRLKMNLSDEEFDELTIEGSLKLFDKHGKDTARVVAIVILKSALMDFLFGRWLAKRLLKNLQFSFLSNIMEMVTLGGGLEDFMSFIELTKTMRLMRKKISPSQTVAQGS